MKKLPIVVLVVVGMLFAGGVGVYVLVFKHDSANQKSQTVATAEKDACDILNDSMAQMILGGTPSKADASNSADASSDDIVVSQCTYSESLGADKTASQTQKTLSLLVRSSKTTVGKQANAAVFVSGAMPINAVAVTGYGESAFWNPDFGQLNILNGGNWYILEYGVAVPSGRKLEDAKKMADTLVNQF